MTGVGHGDESDGIAERSAFEAGPLLEQTRWVLDDLAGRVESFNQRAGVMLGVSVAVIALAIPTVASLFTGGAAWVAGCLVVAPFVLPVGFALATLRVRSGHGIGPVAIRDLVDANGYPLGESGVDIERALLRSLMAQADGGHPSVVDGLNSECEKKGTLLERTQWALVGASAFAVAAAVIVAVVGR